MLEKASMYLTNQLYIKGEIQESKIAVIKYGFEILISSFFILFSVSVYAIILFRLLDGIIFLVFFMPIRLFSGGFHAHTYGRCYICTMLLFVLVIFLAYVIPVTNISLVICILIFSCFYIIQKAPCVNVHHPLSERRYRKNRKYARITIIIESVMSFILFLADYRLCTISVYTLLLVVAMMLFSRKEGRAC